MKPVFATGNHKTVQKLTRLLKEAKKDKQIRVTQRIQGIIMSIDRYRTSEIANILKVNRTTVPLWITSWNLYGEDGLLEGYRCGRTPKMQDLELEKLTDIIESGPVAYGLNTGVWTSKIVKNIIDMEFGINYHAGHVRKMLKKLGFSVQRPSYKLVKGDPKEKNKWVRYTYPKLKKKPKKKTLA